MYYCLSPTVQWNSWFHRQLKTALKAQPNPASWIDDLPLMLSIRTTLKADPFATAAEIVYGTMLRLPGEFRQPSDSKPVIDPTDYISQKSHAMCLPNGSSNSMAKYSSTS